MLQLYHNLIVIIQDCKTILCNPTLVMHTMAIHVMFHDDYQCSWNIQWQCNTHIDVSMLSKSKEILAAQSILDTCSNDLLK